ncbi:hypothetical protein MASR2M15_24540 [Anaerolineales bacterium]
MASRRKIRQQWYRVDLHIHTPASTDYHEPYISYIDILRKAEQTGLDIIAFTDHNTVGGYAAMMKEIQLLEYLKQSQRANAEELRLLAEYYRLLDKVLVLPGFEFTATFGFHVLAIFSPQTPIRVIEHLLLSLNVPPHALEHGDPAAGSTSDVLKAYETIAQAGGLVIAAHANASHGVAMRGMGFGGQTRMAYTQDPNLHALELTDLHKRARGATQRLFNGTKPEYPRRMHCIQGSDAHSLDSFKEGTNTRFGIGERVTEVTLPERSFEALLALFKGTDFTRTRPYNPNRQPYDHIAAAREEGPSLVQSFHQTFDRKGGHLHNIVADVAAFANTNGGTVFIGISANKKHRVDGIENPEEAIRDMEREIGRLISPPLDVEIDLQETQGTSIIRIIVPYGEDRPYAISDNRIYIRDESETGLAVRDEIVNLVRQGLIFQNSKKSQLDDNTSHEEATQQDEESEDYHVSEPQSGVEIIAVEERNKTSYYTMRDLRNGNIVRNVTRSSARRLWHYAIQQYEVNPVDADKLTWHGDMAVWRKYSKAGQVRYDLVQRFNTGIRTYYGVTDSGISDQWEAFITEMEE